MGRPPGRDIKIGFGHSLLAECANGADSLSVGLVALGVLKMLAGQFIVIEYRKQIVGHVFLSQLPGASWIGVAIGEIAYHDRRCVVAMLRLVRSLVFLDGLGLILPWLLRKDHHPRPRLRTLKNGFRRHGDLINMPLEGAARIGPDFDPLLRIEGAIPFDESSLESVDNHRACFIEAPARFIHVHAHTGIFLARQAAPHPEQCPALAKMI